MKNVLIVFGGRSAEHEISIISARNIINAIDRKKYNPVIVAISRLGNWHLLQGTEIPEEIKEVNDDLDDTEVCWLMRRPGGSFIASENTEKVKIDIAIPVLHGPMGEDGTIQGMFEMMMIPYVGPGVLACSLSMDKDAYKRILLADELPIVPYVSLRKNELILSYEEVCEGLETNVFFVKSSTLGSSVGVYKVSNESEYLDALDNAFEYSTKVIVEKAIIGARELECAVLGNNDPIATGLGEIKPNHDFYSYEAKYLDPNGADLDIPAQDINPDLEETLKELSLRAFLAAECCGMARIDFLISEEGDIYINELNPIPGFTNISMYPKLCAHYGIKYPELISNLIHLAQQRFEEKSLLSLVPNLENQYA